MSFHWQDHLKIASFLIASARELDTDEAAFRSAISRAYYAAFGIARLIAVNEGVSLSHTGDDHGEVMNYFLTPSEVKRQQIGTTLDRLRNRRNEADYRDRLRGVPSSEAQTAVRMASTVISQLTTLGQGSP